MNAVEQNQGKDVTIMKKTKKQRTRQPFNPKIVVRWVPRPSEQARDRAYEEWVDLYLKARRNNESKPNGDGEEDPASGEESQS